MLERDVERRLVARLKKLGITHLKMTPTGQVGWPDRLIILPNKQVIWIELKAPGREDNLSPRQVIIHRKLADLNHLVLVSSDVEECMEFIKYAMDTSQLSAGSN